MGCAVVTGPPSTWPKATKPAFCPPVTRAFAATWSDTRVELTIKVVNDLKLINGYWAMWLSVATAASGLDGIFPPSQPLFKPLGADDKCA